MQSPESIVRYLRSLKDKELAEIFYAATRDRLTSDLAEEDGHWVVADVALTEGGKWSLDVIAMPDPTHYRDGEWASDLPVCQSGFCKACGFQLRSWAKHMLCPVCRSNAYGT